MAGGHAWLGVCMAGGNVWLGGACVAGGGCVWHACPLADTIAMAYGQ